MTISVGWSTDQVITVQKTDMVQVQAIPVEVYELNVNTFFTTLKNLEATPEGMPWPDTQANNSPTTLGGLTYARVLEILDPYTITFEDGQYLVDLVGANSNILDRTNPNQVSVRGNNSAGLVGTRQLENLGFSDDRIWVDTLNGQAGTAYPLGLPATPSSNFPDAITIQQQRGLPPRFRGVGSANVPAGNLDNYDLLGAGPDLSVFSIDPGVSTDYLVVEKAFLSGTLDGTVSLRDCHTGVLTGFNGSMFRCQLTDTVTLDATAVGVISLHTCNSKVAAYGRPTLDMNGTLTDVILDRYTGGIEITNMTGNNAMTINADAASVRIAASCTAGVIKIRGDAAIENLAVNNPGLTVLVYEDQEDSKWEKIEKMWTRLGLNPANPITDTNDGITSEAGDITIDRTGDGVSTSTLTRQ